MTPTGYQIAAELCRGEQYVMYRGRREADRVPVLLKSPLRQPARAAQIEGLRRQFTLLSDLSLPGVPRAYELVRSDGTCWLVLEDAGAMPLASLLAAGPIELSTFFHLALQLAAILAELHRRDIIHRNIQPESILVHPATRALQLDGFALASRGSGETQTPVPPALLSGALPYMSPEQTGRMNRTTDYRTDFYSLGATFYEMLTGLRPFGATDALELIHSHIASRPVSPAERRAGVPEAVSAIVMKLLEKRAEARYQSAHGLKADLERCAREWGARRAIAPFPLGTHDVSDRFLIPQELYGREREVRELTRGFERVCQGPAALMLVAGYSGVGKTSLIQELYRPIVRQRGHFIAGKFDQVMRNIPYGALLQAFRGLVQQLLTESEERLGLWRTRIETALGANAGVLTEVMPEIELIIGPRPAAPPLAAAEAQNRFRLVFQNFVGALVAREHPMVVFLDDLQWADAASLALLQSLLTSLDLQFLYVIGAYRDNEVDADHQLTRTAAALEAAGVPVDRIALAPLGLPDLTRFAADCLHRDDAEIAALAQLVASKTEGNPFFVIQFLKTLWQERLLVFDHDQQRWVFHIDDIAGAPMTDNVVDLMSRKIQRLSAATQRVLTLAACVGNPFDLPTLAIVSQQSPQETGDSLREALDNGLVLRVAGQDAEGDGVPGAGLSTYAFLHDRVQQAAYVRLPIERRQELHLAVGRLLQQRWQRGTAEERVFDVVGHLNLGRDLMTDAAERLALARLNLTAGVRAKSSTAYEAALGYFTAGLELLPESHWSSDYALMFELHREAAECAYLCGDFDDAERRFENLLARAATALDKAQVYDLRVVQYENMSRFAEAARIGLEGVALFGVSFPADTAARQNALEIESALIDRRLAGRSIASLVELPVMEDAETRMVMRLLTDTWAPAYIAGGDVVASLISARMTRLSIEHGNTEDSAYGYVTHAISVGPVRGDYRSAYEWGALALAVNERFGDQKRRAKIHQQFNAHVTLWRRPLESCAHHAREAYRSGLESGDFTYAGYGAFTESWPAFLTSRDLDAYVRDLSPNLALLRRIRTFGLAGAHSVMLNWARALQGRTENPLSLSDANFDEGAYAAENADNPFFMTVLHVAKLHLALHCEDFAAARDAALAARQWGWGRGTIWPVLLEFWGGLALTGLYRDAGAHEQQAYWAELVAARGSLQLLAENCPENFRCFFLLLSAEMESIEGGALEALALCEEAIRYARQTDSLQHEALAHELGGRAWLPRNERVAAVYLGEARRCYRAWGAAAKVRQLEERYPPLRAGEPEEAAPSLDVASVTQAAHALAGEIVLDELLRKLMRIAIQNAGAERGFFLQEKDGHLVIEAEGVVDHDAVSLLGSLPLQSSSGLSRAVVQYVRKTGTSLVLADAAADQRFAADPYILAARPKSILCMPVVHQGARGGILYLENNLTTDAFTAERIAVLDVLSSQAAISLENARLYRERTEEVARRTRAEEDLRAALAEVESLKNRLEAENVYLQEEIRREHNFEEMVGNSPPLLQVLRTVEQIAPTDATVLIGGETGVGKELIARAIHDRSARKGRPLVKVNCAVIAAGLVESELFGHVKGAFTGALEKRIGRFELAQGGTIFLDEVGELPLETQVKLLRVLQEREFEPVGSNRTTRVDVRVIAATNRDLNEAIRSGRFRADLFYRLNVLPLTVPPLRQRRADIPQLVEFFLQRFARKFGKAVDAVSQETMELLLSYPWPGNIRELQNVIERAVVLSTGTVLSLGRDQLPRTDAPQPPPAPAAAAISDRSLDDVERQHVIDVLQKTKGVIEGPAGAARILGLHPNTLRSRMKKLGVRRDSGNAG